MIKAIFRSPATSAVLFLVAAALLLGGAIGAVQAAPRIQSNDYYAQAKLTNIKTELLEMQGGKWDGKAYTGGDFKEVHGDDSIAMLITEEAGDGKTLKLGKTYNEQLAVRNSGTIDEYVRVTVKKYWVPIDENQNPMKNPDKAFMKKYDLNPGLIKLSFVEKDGWTIDEPASTPEQTVLYYRKAIKPGEKTTAFTDTLTIDASVGDKAKNIDDDEAYPYKGVRFQIQAQVDAVQTHNADDAMKSAWGQTLEDVITNSRG